MRIWKSVVASLLSVLCIAAVVGCGSSSSSSTGGSSSSGGVPSTTSTSTPADPAVAKLVPSAIKSKGTLTVAADASYAPNEFIGPDGKTVIGMDADLVKALGGVMGLKVNVVNATFDSIIPGLAAGKYDLGASSFTDTKEREKTVDFVDYFVAGTSFYTKASGGATVNSLADLCGHTVAVEKGTTQQTDATAQGSKCKTAGKSGVTVLVFPDQNGANLALSSGRAQLVMADSPVAAYGVKKSNGQFKVVGQTYGTAPYGLAIPKTAGLTKAVLAALEVLQKNGAYTKILTTWGVQAGALAKPKINGATS
ncbi:MAG: polar amino acid transport system substrate-binding protein [Solirubrobacteraceae bacterium]|jgi:polar amino acid transport system substrate-binding protein|nr:polar amino acid transport system substrate-binding protein [Solirubrobacteraceae bacterium]